MKLNAIGISSSNMTKTIEFYSLLGFEFPENSKGESHVEPTTTPGSARLMIDTKELLETILGEPPKPSNHSSFAIQYDTVEKLNAVAKKIANNGYKVFKEPWDAFWGQRYAIVEDPDGYKTDLYAYLEKNN